MRTIQNQTFDEERALYGSRDIAAKDCSFDGPADGESAFKECRNVEVSRCFFNLRYPFWHDHGLVIRDSEMTELCRAALWYSEHITIENSRLHGIKALRECADVKMTGCDIVSPEFGWSVRNLAMKDCSAESEYFMMRSAGLHFDNVRMKGKYSFQYIEDSVFENCTFDTKDAFWHAKNVTVRDNVVKGEYLACESTVYRVLRRFKANARRDGVRSAIKRHKPTSYEATGPNQVWTWDITYLRDAEHSTRFYYAFAVIDIYSRYMCTTTSSRPRRPKTQCAF